jgi:hypothetical protein
MPNLEYQNSKFGIQHYKSPLQGRGLGEAPYFFFVDIEYG